MSADSLDGTIVYPISVRNVEPRDFAFDAIHDFHEAQRAALREKVLTSLDEVAAGLDLNDGDDRANFRSRIVEMVFHNTNPAYVVEIIQIACSVVPRRPNQSKTASHHRALADAYLAERGFLPNQMNGKASA